MNWEKRCELMLSRCSIVDVLEVQMADFKEMYQDRPTCVVMHINLKGAFIKEVFLQNGHAAGKSHGPEFFEKIVLEPIWLNNGAPLLFRNLGDSFMQVTNNRIRKELTL